MKIFENVKLYDWVPFFKELSLKIAELAVDETNRNDQLKVKVISVFGADHALIKYNAIDPFSFIYLLAQKNTINQRQNIYNLVAKNFGLKSAIPTDWIFPTPSSNALAFFFSEKGYLDRKGNLVDEKILWNLFVDAANTGKLKSEEFKTALSLKHVRITKLSQALFLINSEKFWAIDDSALWLPIYKDNERAKLQSDIEENGLIKYLEVLDVYKSYFPSCSFCEINLLAYLLFNNKQKLIVTNNHCQISSWIYGQGEDDYFDDFVDNNYVRTGGAGSTKGNITYPVKDFKDGDIVLVRRGTKNLGGIGIIILNEYITNGYSNNKVIHIVWINKENKKLDDALGDWTGFKGATEKTKKGFQSVYSNTFELLTKIREKQGFTTILNLNRNGNMIPKNIILYGPPGTGKTYSTISRAIKIANPTFIFPADPESEEGRKLVKSEFERLQHENQISFITFHQSLSYEDFIEGIKPELNESNQLKLYYKVKPGLFKRSAAIAAWNCYIMWKEENVEQRNTSFSFEEIYEAFVDHLKERLQNGEMPEFYTITGKTIIVKSINKNSSIVAVGKNSKRMADPPAMTKENFQKLYDYYADIDEVTSLEQIQKVVVVQPNTSRFYALFRGIKDFEKTFVIDESSEDLSYSLPEEEELIRQFEAGVYNEAVQQKALEADPVVLIIDEINRGNISAIFGELITLIEKDKRWGDSIERLKCVLPYSKMEFYVPANLYIIGTMNTADRSVEALDTALRRRFDFEFIPPNEDKVPEQVETVPLRKAFRLMNERISYLLDQDQRIGHSYFMDVSDLKSLRDKFKNRIIPLLKEYFYNDFGKIRLVLGDGFVTKTDNYLPKFAVDDTIEIGRDTYFINNIDDDFLITDALTQLIGKE